MIVATGGDFEGRFLRSRAVDYDHWYWLKRFGMQLPLLCRLIVIRKVGWLVSGEEGKISHSASLKGDGGSKVLH